MKRFDEKVKDLVEVRSSSTLGDFLAEPSETLAGYHFTDITADLMANWLDRIAGVKKGAGVALAMAGFRGVGKSHFLAALGAIVSRPDLRSEISDPHVAASAQRLSRRHGLVAHVRRGSLESLPAELKKAIAELTSSRGSDLSDSIGDLMAASASKSVDLPPVIVIDTAFGRESRVSRDDGLMLSDIAAAAKELGVFVALALDDDIAGADGINSSIAGSFDIDYLDQEHLYKIVNAHVFTKYEKRRPVLHDIYESYRQSMPGFRWSESRFSSLYPLHPAILEIAPFVRLYLHDFALLGFASEAGVRILGRPANSLIGLDEVFDSVENRLRNVGDLSEAFAAYDSLDRGVVAKAPVMQRHEAKLILKGLFLLSLTGEGVNAAELAASMLIFDEHDVSAAATNVEAAFHTFAAPLPGSIKVTGASVDAKYALKGGSEDDISATLENAAAAISTDVVWPILRKQTAEKFVHAAEHDPANSAKCDIVWRGSIRRGEVVWTGDEADRTPGLDWCVYLKAGPNDDKAAPVSACEWRLGQLTADDLKTLKRFHVLQTDAGFRDQFRDSISTVLHVHVIAVEKIWQRVFLEEGYLLADNTEYRFSEEARGSHTLSQLFTLTLDEYFAAQFPSHPKFAETLQDQHSGQIIQQLFSGSGGGSEIQELAGVFARPLGLVVENEGVLLPVGPAELFELPVIKSVLAGISDAKDGLLRLEDLASGMQSPPYGLTHEAQHLVLGALVAQKQFEFVTTTGNRINHRSLDLQIVWDDIVGLAQPSDDTYSNERLLKWAAVLTGKSGFKSLKSSEARLAVIDALTAWFHEWQQEGVVEQFEKLTDGKLNTRIWAMGVAVKKTFGVAADAIDGMLDEGLDLEQCLQKIADAFWDSDEEYTAKKAELKALTVWLSTSAEVDQIREYLVLSDTLQDAAIDEMRADLLERISRSAIAEIDTVELRPDFEKFRSLYSESYAQRHDVVMASGITNLEKYLASDQFTAFADLASFPIFGRKQVDDATDLIRQVRSLKCTADVRGLLERQPSCNCSFSSAGSSEPEMLIDELQGVVERGLEFVRDELAARMPTLADTTEFAIFDIINLADLSPVRMQALRNSINGLPPAIPQAEPQRRANRTRAVLDRSDLSEIEDALNSLGPTI